MHTWKRDVPGTDHKRLNIEIYGTILFLIGLRKTEGYVGDDYIRLLWLCENYILKIDKQSEVFVKHTLI